MDAVVRSDIRDGRATLRVEGDVDAHGALGFETAVLRVFADGGPDLAEVVIDLSAVTFFDSSGLGVLVHLRERCRWHPARLRIRNAPAQVAKLLQLTGLAAAFDQE